MPGTRLRQVRVRWREGFDDREFTDNDRPMERRWVDEGAEDGLVAAGWTLEFCDERDGNWERIYTLREGVEEGAYVLVFVTNPGVIGPPAKEYRAAVAVRGEWAVCSAPFGEALAEVYRLRAEGWTLHARLKAQCAARVDWLPAIRFQGEMLLRWETRDGLAGAGACMCLWSRTERGLERNVCGWPMGEWGIGLEVACGWLKES